MATKLGFSTGKGFLETVDKADSLNLVFTSYDLSQYIDGKITINLEPGFYIAYLDLASSEVNFGIIHSSETDGHSAASCSVLEWNTYRLSIIRQSENNPSTTIYVCYFDNRDISSVIVCNSGTLYLAKIA